DPLRQRLQQSRCLHRCSDCYRVERTSSRAGIPPLWTSAFTAHPVCPSLGNNRQGETPYASFLKRNEEFPNSCGRVVRQKIDQVLDKRFTSSAQPSTTTICLET